MKGLLVPDGTLGAISSARRTPSGLQVWYAGVQSERIFRRVGGNFEVFHSDGIERGYSWHPIDEDIIYAVAGQGICDTSVQLEANSARLISVIGEWILENYLLVK